MPPESFDRLDQVDVLRVLFHPRRDIVRNDNQSDVLFIMPDGVQIGGRFHCAGPSFPLILLFHGNGEIASDYDLIAPLYVEMGVSLLVADYRGYGRSGGTPTSSALLSDAHEILGQLARVIEERGAHFSKLFVMGRSLGSAAAVEITARAGDSVSGLIIESGFVDSLALIERLGGPALSHLGERKVGFNNIGKIRQVRVPTLVIHGEEDFIIPLEEGEALFQQCGSHKKQFLSIPGAGHNDLLLRGRREYFQAIRKFVFD